MRRCKLPSLILIISLVFSVANKAHGDFVERLPVGTPQQALANLNKEVESLKPNGPVAVLVADAGAPILTIARGPEGYKLSILISQFMLAGHGDVANDEVYLNEFPVRPGKDRGIAFKHLIASKEIVTILNEHRCGFRMVSVGMREREGAVLSWAQSRIETVSMTPDKLQDAIKDIVPIAFGGAAGAKFVTWEQSENQP